MARRLSMINLLIGTLMPVNRSHAFANGPVFGRFSALQRVMWRVLRCVSFRAETRSKVARAWQQFDSSATVNGRTLLGPNAWCFNGLRDRSRVLLQGRVVCRGLLRVETFGDGRIHIQPDVYIGDDCLISCAASVLIGQSSLLAHGVQIFDNTTHPLDWNERLQDWHAIGAEQRVTKPEIPSAPVVLEEQVWVGMNSIILKGVTIGKKSVIAAGSVVTKDVPPETLAAGNPARAIKQLTSSQYEA